MSCQPYFCVRPRYGVVQMPECDYRCMPVEGAQVPKTNYYKKLLKEIPQGRTEPQLELIDCDTQSPVQMAEWMGVQKGEYSHTFTDQQVLNLGSLLAINGATNPGVHSVHIAVRTTAGGVVLTRGGGVDMLYEDDTREWRGADDGIGNLANATDFALVMSLGDEVVINWVEIGDA